MTAEMARSVLGIEPATIVVVTHIGVDCERFAPRPPCPDEPKDRTLTIGYCGQLSEHKGVLDLVEAVRALRDQGADIALKVVGSGPLEPQLRRLAANAAWLSILGRRPNSEIPEFLRQLDLFVMPSRVLADHQEHDGHAVLEAMSCGLPTVATRSGILSELVDDENGTLAEPGDVKSLADAIARVFSSPAVRQRLGRTARQRALERYDHSKVARHLVSVYQDALGV
jgi:glycosyltransferase involved in cell wall biosynthesis